MNKKNNKLKKNAFYKVLSIIYLVISVFFMCFLIYINLLPSKYIFIFTIINIIFTLFNVWLLNINRLKKKIKKIISGVAILISILFLIISFYLFRTLDVLNDNGHSKYKLEHYYVIVKNDSKYKKVKDIENNKLGYYQNSSGANQAIKHLAQKVNIIHEAYKTSDELVNDLLNDDISVILLESSIKNIMSEEFDGFSEKTEVIYEFTIKVESSSSAKEVNITKEPFVVYLSGIDTYGEISSVSRSDVNIVMLVNPNTYQVLLISIPRDYYVQLHGTTGNKDKLAHAGIYGTDMSIKTLEDLLEIEINYYLKVNFTSVIDIVDTLGGLDVYSEYSFVSYSGYKFKKGYNSVNGEQALDFARTRKAFVNGDRQRGINQQALIESIIRKATSKSIITKYNSLLNSINGKYQTNMSSKKIISFVKMQLEEMPKWNITSYSLTGTDSKNYTYTYNQLLYVMEPDEESVKGAIELINQVLNDGTLESSYGELTGSINKVTKTYTTQTNNVNNTQTSDSKEIDNIEEKEEPKDEEVKEESDESEEEVEIEEDNKEDIEEEIDETKDQVIQEEQEEQEDDSGKSTKEDNEIMDNDSSTTDITT